MTGRLDGKVALITGATTGIGEAIAHKIGNGALLRECTLQIPHCGLNTASFNSRYRILAMVHCCANAPYKFPTAA